MQVQILVVALFLFFYHFFLAMLKFNITNKIKQWILHKHASDLMVVGVLLLSWRWWRCCMFKFCGHVIFIFLVVFLYFYFFLSFFPRKWSSWFQQFENLIGRDEEIMYVGFFR
jgi:hypothetical protein